MDYEEMVGAAMKAKLDFLKDNGPLASTSDWDSESFAGLGKLVSENFRSCFRVAIKKISEHGYKKEDAESAVLKCGPYYGTKDMVSTIVECVLLHLRSQGSTDGSSVFNFETLESLAEYMSMKMVTELIKIKPSLSVPEALWTLLVCDLSQADATHAEIHLLRDAGKAVEGESSYADSKHVPQDDKDEAIRAAVARVGSLQKELETWEDWAKTKVMQVTNKLKHVRPELIKLRAEKEEAEKLKKDEEEMVECTKKRLSEMAIALDNYNQQTRMARSAAVELRNANSIIKKEMEAAKTESALAAKNLEEARRKEQEALEKSQSFRSEKKELEEELKASKSELAGRQQELEKARDILRQTEIRLANEKRKTVEAVRLAESIKGERENLEALAKESEEKMSEEAEKELETYEKKKKRMQDEISSMQRGLNWQPSRRLQVSRQTREWECVMCLENQKTVVFLPCRHQVLCAECDVIHEEIGMNDCPSCRTPIQKRINVRFANS